MLWLCLHFPDLPLELFTRGRAAGPLALTVGKASRRAIFQASAEASAAGVRPGMAVSAALALAPGLTLRARDEAAEEAALEGLASWASQFTSLLAVSPTPFPALLLEVEGSLALFGGPEALRERIRDGVGDLGYRVLAAAAPTPLGAELLARAGEELWISDPGLLGGELAPLSLRTLGLLPETQKNLEGLGLRTIGQCTELPPGGLARRFGSEFPALLARAFGRSPDPRRPFVPPARFDARLELGAEISACEALLFGARRLLLELEGFLRGRGSGVEAFRLRLFGRDRTPLEVEVELASPGRDADRLLKLLRERLERISLPGPVSAIGLSASKLTPLSAQTLDFFRPVGAEKEREGALLVERLRARLGGEAVHRLRLLADHRPERSFCSEPFGSRETSSALESSPASSPLRPLWLLPEPKPLESERLTLLAGPERIETGWWDGAVARDYYVAEGPQGDRLWIFRADSLGDWFLHGIFG